MRKVILAALIAATAFPAAAMAQSAGELRRDQREIRREQQDVRQAQRHGSNRDVREQRQDVREARQEYREDWRDYKRTHRDVYRGAGYRAPFRYRNWQAGVAISPAYYAPRYVINDYGRYRLPAPRANTRWVRHYNDVLLVNYRTGRVVQVIRGFYW